jgi:hypothetical protein
MVDRAKITGQVVRFIMYVVLPGAVTLMAAIATLAME